MKTIHTFNEIRIRDLLDNYWDRGKFLELCKNCGNYGKLWSCPPYDFNIYDHIMQYNYVYIIGTKMIFSDKTIESNSSENAIREFTKSTLEKMRNILGEKLLALEDEIKQGKSLYAGSCLLCENCNREDGENCCNVDMMRYSLESLGFDVSKIAGNLLDIELKWASDRLPEYYTLVSAFLSKERIKDYESTLATMFD
ncbi:Predicted metal-binding protein [Dethiosulfatibacter aminovorans DSM 17477]|uniref:Predicted metal-binding protein n=1 Tax=Dethiosulfatibacter aminovorans DSM 17477 TaxID=1121476 RepID=A0A1M6JKS3_9FIRM|nr:DUF2284 domain-containing protein [Dethiosulfatibacter aminovorans]SHJ47311.1 Predicted metal-binding protein [Dethiosulfatibacter aminovorans DSM 17477]